MGHTVTTREETVRHSQATNMMGPPTPLHMTQQPAQLASRKHIESIGLHTTIATTNAPVTQYSS